MTDTPKPELKPCPFCGGNDLTLFPPSCRAGDPYDTGDRAFPIIRCGGCYTDVPGDNFDHNGGTAIEAWNTRAPQWQPIETAPPFKSGHPLLCRNKNHWPEICYIKNGMAFNHAGLAMVGFVPIEWNSAVGMLNWFNEPLPTPPNTGGE